MLGEDITWLEKPVGRVECFVFPARLEVLVLDKGFDCIVSKAMVVMVGHRLATTVAVAVIKWVDVILLVTVTVDRYPMFVSVQSGDTGPGIHMISATSGGGAPPVGATAVGTTKILSES